MSVNQKITQPTKTYKVTFKQVNAVQNALQANPKGNDKSNIQL